MNDVEVPEWVDYPEIHRVSHLATCEICGLEFWRHPDTQTRRRTCPMTESRTLSLRRQEIETVSDIWLYSTNEEWWDGLDEFLTRDEAIEAGRHEAGGTRFFTGRRKALFFGDAVFFDDMAERAAEHFYDEVGEAAEDYAPMVDDEAREELRKLLNDWATKHNVHPQFFTVVDVEEHQP